MSSFSIGVYTVFMNSEELRKTVAGNMRKYRKLNNLTQMALAEKANISVGYLCDLESGKKWGMPETISKIATSMNIQPFQLFMTDVKISNFPPSADLLQLYNNLKQNIDEEFTKLLKKYSH